jgi:hypothetical protein
MFSVLALKRLFYVSRVAAEFDDADLRRLVAHSQMRNRRLDVTGMLACSGRHFAQVLEGRAADVDALAAHIGKDARHTEVRIVLAEAITQRDFGEWSMGYVEGLLNGTDLPEGAAAFCSRLFADPRL